MLSQALRGNVKCIEALCAPPTSVITSSKEWNEITQLLDPVKLLSRTFVDRCIGQAFGALVKKHQHKGKWVVRDDATLNKFSDSFRYMYMLHCYCDNTLVTVVTIANIGY